MSVVEKRISRNESASTAELMEQRCDCRFHPLFGIAMLKVSFELRPVKYPGFDQILRETMRGIQADEAELENFVRLNRPSLERRCKEIGI